MTSHDEFIILCRNDREHTPVVYTPARHGTTVVRYATRTACAEACARLNAQAHTTETE